MKQGTVDARAGADISWSHPHRERADVLTKRNWGWRESGLAQVNLGKGSRGKV